MATLKESKAQIGSNVQIAPTAIIGDNVTIGDNTKISDFVIIRDNTSIGANCTIHPNAVIGEDPQDFSFKGEESFVEIGDNNTIREFVTIHKAAGEGAITSIGDNNYIMAYSHVAHNCKLHNGIIMANSVQLGGHVEIFDNAVIGGLAAIHQNCKIGRLSMFAGSSGTNKDIPPFFMYGGTPAIAVNVNSLGLRKAGLSSELRAEIFKAFKVIYKSELHNLKNIIPELERSLKNFDETRELIDFLKDSKRGIRIKGHDEL